VYRHYSTVFFYDGKIKSFSLDAICILLINDLKIHEDMREDLHTHTH